METTPHPLVVLKNIGLITLLGFAAIVLSGPVIAVLGTLLPFFAIGCVLYIFYKALTLGPRVAWALTKSTARAFWRVFVGIPVSIIRFVFEIVPKSVRGVFAFVFAIPLWILRCFGRGISALGRTILGVLRFAWSATGMALLGATVGLALGVIGGLEHNDLLIRAPMGAALGMVIGVLAAAAQGSSSPQKNRVLIAQPVEALASPS